MNLPLLSIVLLSILGVTTGFLSGLLGVGGGIILVPALTLLFGMGAHKAIGVSLVVIIPTALAAAAKHFQQGDVDLAVVFAITVGSIIGAVLGSQASAAIPEIPIRRLFGIVAILVGLNMIFVGPAVEATDTPSKTSVE